MLSLLKRFVAHDAFKGSKNSVSVLDISIRIFPLIYMAISEVRPSLDKLTEQFILEGVTVPAYQYLLREWTQTGCIYPHGGSRLGLLGPVRVSECFRPENLEYLFPVLFLNSTSSRKPEKTQDKRKIRMRAWGTFQIGWYAITDCRY